MTRPRITEAFLRYHRANPHVYRMLVHFTREAQARCGGQVSVQLVLERARWETYLEASGDDPYRLPNAHAAFYARLIMHLNHDLRGVFVLRPSVADEDGRLVDQDQLEFWPEAQQDDGWLEEAARAVLVVVEGSP